MKSTKKSGDLRPEYRLDYGLAKANRFQRRASADSVIVVLDRDVARVFKDDESVNSALRAILQAVPTRGKSHQS